MLDPNLKGAQLLLAAILDLIGLLIVWSIFLPIGSAPSTSAYVAAFLGTFAVILSSGWIAKYLLAKLRGKQGE